VRCTAATAGDLPVATGGIAPRHNQPAKYLCVADLSNSVVNKINRCLNQFFIS
jgi:hypothetical protein